VSRIYRRVLREELLAWTRKGWEPVPCRLDPTREHVDIFQGGAIEACVVWRRASAWTRLCAWLRRWT
jgi:hypothetical protein